MRCSRSKAPMSLVGADPQEADRRARSARHPAARARQARRAWVLASETCALDIIGARVRARNRERRGGGDHRRGRRYRISPSAEARRGSASSNTSISRGPISIVGGRSVYEVRKEIGPATGARGAGRRRRRHSRFPIPACPPRSAIARQAACPSNSASSATIMSAAPSSSRRADHPPARREAEAQRQRAADQGQAHRADRRLHRARHDLGEDRADDARGGRAAKCICGSPARRSRSPISTASTRRTRTSCSRPTGASRRCASSSASTSLAFLSVDGIYKAMGYDGRDNAHPQFTDHCFTGDYPTRAPETAKDRRSRSSSPSSPKSVECGAAQDRIALITGASRGIGRAVALAFAREGAHVLLARAHAEGARGG